MLRRRSRSRRRPQDCLTQDCSTQDCSTQGQFGSRLVCRRRGPCEVGQSTVEFVLVLPVLLLAVLVVVQVGLVVRDSLVVQDLAREAARAAAVEPRQVVVDQVIRQGSARLDPQRTLVSLDRGVDSGQFVTATVGYESPTSVPIVGLLIGDVYLSAAVTMRVEYPASRQG